MKKPANKASEQVDQLSDKGLRQFVGYNMRMAYLRIHDDMMRALKPMGLRVVTFSALAFVIENPDITQTQLAQALKIERSGAVVIVDELENADLISRNRVEGDRRSYALRATLKGRDLWARAEKRVRVHESDVLSQLSEAERESVRLLLGRISETKRAA